MHVLRFSSAIFHTIVQLLTITDGDEDDNLTKHAGHKA